MNTNLFCSLVGMFWIVMAFIAGSNPIMSTGFTVIANVWLAASYIVPDHFKVRGSNR